ncbi:MAG TPA: phosphoribosyltransferase [Baekduia sp.]|uniref:phosphoribosyltransferase n=1 Tax=Baekduia sp. TaxID=2600305 RepID=UPI002C40F364|nr:phosphoribosyltransferase [Baekduia sp.]HMJ35010.1 phosphoribosyltransferase [Baekduia sp.]
MEAAPDTTAVPTDREVMAWDQLGVAARHLAHEVVASGYKPDIVLAIARGGLLPGGAVAYALGVKNSCAMNVEFYTDVDERLEVPMVLPPAPELIDLEHAQMLIVDDVADTGRTLEVVQDFCAGKVAEVRTAVLYEKPQSLVKCDYVWRRTDRWIDFPWSAEPPVEGGGSAVA